MPWVDNMWWLGRSSITTYLRRMVYRYQSNTSPCKSLLIFDYLNYLIYAPSFQYNANQLGDTDNENFSKNSRSSAVMISSLTLFLCRILFWISRCFRLQFNSCPDHGQSDSLSLMDHYSLETRKCAKENDTADISLIRN